jgi:hypothetical protein
MRFTSVPIPVSTISVCICEHTNKHISYRQRKLLHKYQRKLLHTYQRKLLHKCQRKLLHKCNYYTNAFTMTSMTQWCSNSSSLWQRKLLHNWPILAIRAHINIVARSSARHVLKRARAERNQRSARPQPASATSAHITARSRAPTPSLARRSAHSPPGAVRSGPDQWRVWVCR